MPYCLTIRISVISAAEAERRTAGAQSPAAVPASAKAKSRRRIETPPTLLRPRCFDTAVADWLELSTAALYDRVPSEEKSMPSGTEPLTNPVKTRMQSGAAALGMTIRL